MSDYPQANPGIGVPNSYPPYPDSPPVYPPSNNFTSLGFQPPNQQGSMVQGYPPVNTGYPTSPLQQPNNMGGYPTSPIQQPNNMGGYPTSPIQQPNNMGGYPSPSGYPNTGGYPNVGDGGALPGFKPEICPTAPDLSHMGTIPGYEHITFKEEILTPPSVPGWEPEQKDVADVENFPVLTEEEVREALAQYALDHCCYGSAVGRDMKVNSIVMMSAFHYKLETFTEKRESAWRTEPYNGLPVDGPMNGPAPSPWEVTAIPKEYFKDSVSKIEVPHTAFVKPCHDCVGIGRVRCHSCLGNGRKQCTWCKGRGNVQRAGSDDMCTSCNGTGFDRCSTCSGEGQVKCKTCSSKGNLKSYVELVVTWTKHVDDYISETSSMPSHLVEKVSGQVAYEDENLRVLPIVHPSDQAVTKASNELVNKHSTAFPNERILKQRHRLRLIPIGEIQYEWKGKSGEFYVYGYEHKVYFSDYPQKCCCCCIL